MAQKTVLIVDNDQASQSRLAAALDGQEWEVLLESEGDWALKTFRARRVDLVVIALSLPVLDGFGVVEMLRSTARGRAVPIIMIAEQYLERTARLEAIQRYGLVDVLHKPVRVARFRALLDEVFAETAMSAKGAGMRDEAKKSDIGVRKDRKNESPVERKTRSTLPLTPISFDGAKETPENTPAGLPDPQSGKPESRDAQTEGDGSAERGRHKIHRPPIPMRGRLEAVDFGALLHELHRLQATGGLYVMREKIKKIVYLRNGLPVQVKSNLRGEYLGRLLVREGRISEAQCAQSLLRMERTGRRQGPELVAMGLLRSDALLGVLKRQIQVKLIDIFAWQGGDYVFKENVRVPAEAVGLGRTVATLIYDAVRVALDLTELRHRLSGWLDAYPAPAADPELRFQVLQSDSAPQAALLYAMDGEKRLGEVLAAAALDPETAYALVYTALAVGIVELWTQPIAGPSWAADIPLFPTAAQLAEMTEPQAIAHLAEQLETFRDSDHYAILGVSVDAGSDALQEAYALRARAYHPDRFIRFGEACQELAEALFGVFKDVVKVLLDPQKRRLYDARTQPDADLESEPLQTEASEEQIRRVTRPAALDAAVVSLEANRRFEAGKSAGGQGRWEAALKHLRAAVRLRPERADYRAFLGWTLFNSAPGDEATVAAAAEDLQAAVELDAASYEAHLLMGLFWDARGEREAAARYLNEAVQRNPEGQRAHVALENIDGEPER